MWKELEIANQLYFLRCAITGNEVLCLFCDFSRANEYWCETMTVTDLIKRSKELNKRIKYDEQTICETVQLSVPVDAYCDSRNVDGNGGDGGGGDNLAKVLHLKYRVHSMLYKCDWHLRLLTSEEIKSHVLLPLFSIVHGMSQQIAELQDAVRKKDVEIMQHRTEGNILRRTTVATQPFNFLEFDEKYAETLDLAKSFGKVAEYMQVDVRPAKETIEKDTNTIQKADVDINTMGDMNEQNNLISPSKKMSPKNRKRKAQLAQRTHLLLKISARQKILDYRSSQSQSQSQSQSDGYDSSDVSNNIEVQLKRASNERVVKEPIVVLPMQTTTKETTLFTATAEQNKTNILPTLPMFINQMDITHSSDATATTASKTMSSSKSSTPPNVTVVAADIEGSQTTILSIAEMNQKLDFILKELKHLEEQRIADMKRRLGGNFD